MVASLFKLIDGFEELMAATVLRRCRPKTVGCFDKAVCWERGNRSLASRLLTVLANGANSTLQRAHSDGFAHVRCSLILYIRSEHRQRRADACHLNPIQHDLSATHFYLLPSLSVLRIFTNTVTLLSIKIIECDEVLALWTYGTRTSEGFTQGPAHWRPGTGIPTLEKNEAARTYIEYLL